MGMEIIFVSKATPARRRWHLGHWGSVLLLSTVTIVSTGAFYVGYRVASPPAVDPWPDLYAAAVEQVVRAQRYDVDEAIFDARDGIDSLALRVGELQARVIRLDALRRRLTEMAELDPEEFAFDHEKAAGVFLHQSQKKMTHKTKLCEILRWIQFPKRGRRTNKPVIAARMHCEISV